MIGAIQMLVLKMEGGGGHSLARGHTLPCLVPLVTNKWATLEMM